MALLVLAVAGAQTPESQLPEGQRQATEHAGKATRLMQERRYEEAAVEFERWLAADPNDDGARVQYATCLFVQERNEESRKQFEIERQRRGDAPGITYYLGRLDLRSNDLPAAIRRLQPLSENPAFPKASFYLGLAYLAGGQTTQALQCLERAALRNPGDQEVHYRLGRSYTMAGRTQEADREFKIYGNIRDMQRLVEEEGHACMDALREEPIQQASKICERIADPKDARRMLLVGQLYVDNGDFAEALEPLRAAAALDPASFDAWQNLGVSLYGLRRYAEALPALQRASVMNPQFFETLRLLAATYHLLGNDTEALPVLERAVKLSPGDSKLAAALNSLRAKQSAGQKAKF